MPVKPVRAPTRRASSALPETQQLNFLLEASALLSQASPQVAAELGRRALQVADGPHAVMPRGAAASMCSRCGLPFTADVYASGKVVKLPRHSVRRRLQAAGKGAAAAGPGQGAKPQVNRAAVIYTCKLCGQTTGRPFYTEAAAQQAVQKAGGTPQRPSSQTAAQQPVQLAGNSNTQQQSVQLADSGNMRQQRAVTLAAPPPAPAQTAVHAAADGPAAPSFKVATAAEAAGAVPAEPCLSPPCSEDAGQARMDAEPSQPADCESSLAAAAAAAPATAAVPDVVQSQQRGRFKAGGNQGDAGGGLGARTEHPDAAPAAGPGIATLPPQQVPCTLEAAMGRAGSLPAQPAAAGGSAGEDAPVEQGPEVGPAAVAAAKLGLAGNSLPVPPPASNSEQREAAEACPAAARLTAEVGLASGVAAASLEGGPILAPCESQGEEGSALPAEAQPAAAAPSEELQAPAPPVQLPEEDASPAVCAATPEAGGAAAPAGQPPPASSATTLSEGAGVASETGEDGGGMAVEGQPAPLAEAAPGALSPEKGAAPGGVASRVAVGVATLGVGSEAAATAAEEEGQEARPPPRKKRRISWKEELEQVQLIPSPAAAAQQQQPWAASPEGSPAGQAAGGRSSPQRRRTHAWFRVGRAWKSGRL